MSARPRMAIRVDRRMMPSDLQAEAIVVLWRQGWDTLAIADALGLDEPAVARLVQAMRDIARGHARLRLDDGRGRA